MANTFWYSFQKIISAIKPYDHSPVIMTDRRSRLEVFCKKDVFKNFATFTGKHLCWSLFNKVAGPRSLAEEYLFSQNTSGGCFWTNSPKFRVAAIVHNCSIKKLFR